MSGNVALDVVIGLVFIYLLYSLYATILMELIASFLGLRARNLSYALRRMLMEEKDYPRNKTIDKLIRLLTSFTRVTGMAMNQENPKLFDKFFEQPNIRYLTSGGIGSTPSYISAENFSKALIDSIKKDDLEAGPLIAIEKGLHESKLLTKNSMVQQHMLGLLDDANSDLVKFKILLEKWYDDTMERASGWYKQMTQCLLIIIGFFIAFSFNVDTLSIIQKLSKDENARNQLVTMAVNFTEKNPTPVSPPVVTSDSATRANSEAALEKSKATFDSLMAVKELLQADIRNSQSILGSTWDIPDSVSYDTIAAKSIKKGYREIEYMVGENKLFIQIPQLLNEAALIAAIKIKDSSNPGYVKVSSFQYKWHYFLAHFWGYLFTVLALSLGAPFWFDLLNKLVKLRTSKALTSEDTNKTENPVFTNRSTLRRAG